MKIMEISELSQVLENWSNSVRESYNPKDLSKVLSSLEEILPHSNVYVDETLDNIIAVAEGYHILIYVINSKEFSSLLDFVKDRYEELDVYVSESEICTLDAFTKCGFKRAEDDLFYDDVLKLNKLILEWFSN